MRTIVIMGATSRKPKHPRREEKRHAIWRKGQKERHMIDFVSASQIASILGNATNIVDKIYDRFFKVKSGKEPPPGLQPQHSAIIRDDPQRNALVSQTRGQEVQTVKYEELATKLQPSDLSYIRAREQAMEQHMAIWERVYPTIPLEMDQIRTVQLELQLKQHTDSLGKELAAILDFLATEVRGHASSVSSGSS
jgi:hypothetical protein